MAVLPQLHDPHKYRPCTWDLKSDAAGRAYWLDLFHWHLDAVLVPLIQDVYAPPSAALAALRKDYAATYNQVAQDPSAFDRIDVLLFTSLRHQVLTRHGFDDPFQHVKTRANEAALDLLPAIVSEIDTTAGDAQCDLLIRGLMAGNIFDLGSRATIQRHADGQTAFRETRQTQRPRPWWMDDVDAWHARWQQRPYCHAVFFVDNAGGDILLGNLPLVRWMLTHDTRVTLAANSAPALNDILASELPDLLARATEHDELLRATYASDQLRILATGSDTPLIDLTLLDESFVAAVADADLIMLHGMGRAIESNFHAAFTCDTTWSAVLKDEAVARHIGAELFDCVFRFHPA